MKFIRWFLISITLIILLSMIAITPLAIIGLFVFLFGIYQMHQKRNGKLTFSRPGWIVAVGIIFSFIVSMIFVEPVEEATPETKKANIEEKVANTEKEKQAEKEAEEKAKKQAAAELKANEEEQKKQAAIQKQQEQKELAQNLNLEAVVVARVVDGDTIELKDGRKVRLVGVNTPESTTRTEKYGKEASNYTTSKLNGKKVWVQKDVSDTDRYSRYLRVIWLAVPSDDMSEKEIRSKMFNAQLVLNGYAEPSTYPPDVKYSDYFVKFAREAREKETGLWAYGDNGTTKGDMDPKAVASKPKQSAPKNNASSSSETTASPPASGGSESYQNCTEMRKVHPNGVPSSHPAYDSKHDRDKDNYACER